MKLVHAYDQVLNSETGKKLSEEFDPERALTYIDKFHRNEYYDPTTGEIKQEVLTGSQRRWRSSKFSTLGKFKAKFSYTANEDCVVTAHAWTNKGEYTGSLPITLKAGTTTMEQSLLPSDGDAYYAFDFLTNDNSVDTINVEITYVYATQEYVDEAITTAIKQVLNTEV